MFINIFRISLRITGFLRNRINLISGVGTGPRAKAVGPGYKEIVLIKVGLLLGLLGWGLPASAQPAGEAPQISIEFGPSQIPIETYFTVSVRLKGTALKQISPFPELEGFQKSSRSSKKTTLKASSNLVEEVYTQNYAALNEGSMVIKPFTMTVNGTVVKSPGTTVQVGPVTAAEPKVAPPVKTPAAASGESFLSLETSKPRVYTGEGVHVALYFYLTAAENGQLEFYDFLNQLPALFKQMKQPHTWEEVFEQTEIRPDTVELNAGRYLRFKLYEAVNYPLNAQNLVYPALALKMVHYTPDPEATFADEKRRSAIKLYRSRPDTVRVLGLPPHPLREVVPVGRYRLDEAIDRTQLPINRAVSYSFAVIGEGNIPAMPAPRALAPPALEFFPPQIKEKVLRQRRRVAGSKQFTYSIIPKAPGVYPLRQALQFIYFDPVREQYDTLASGFTLRVSGAADPDAAIQSSVTGDFYRLIATEDNTLTSLHQFEKVKLYTNLILLLLLVLTIFIFYQKR